MSSKLKGLVVILSIGILIYFISLSNTSVAEDAENEAMEQFAGIVVSVEASVVVIEPEVLEEIIGDSGNRNLNSISLERIMQIVSEEEGEIVSSVKLSMKNNTNAEIETESNWQENRKNFPDEVTERESSEMLVSFRAMSHIIDVEKIVINFDFKEVFTESEIGSTDEVEEQGERLKNFEMSSTVVFRPGQPRIVGATIRDEAMFVIMSADI